MSSPPIPNKFGTLLCPPSPALSAGGKPLFARLQCLLLLQSYSSFSFTCTFALDCILDFGTEKTYLCIRTGHVRSSANKGAGALELSRAVACAIYVAYCIIATHAISHTARAIYAPGRCGRRRSDGRLEAQACVAT